MEIRQHPHRGRRRSCTALSRQYPSPGVSTPKAYHSQPRYWQNRRPGLAVHSRRTGIRHPLALSPPGGKLKLPISDTRSSRSGSRAGSGCRALHRGSDEPSRASSQVIGNQLLAHVCDLLLQADGGGGIAQVRGQRGDYVFGVAVYAAQGVGGERPLELQPEVDQAGWVAEMPPGAGACRRRGRPAD